MNTTQLRCFLSVAEYLSFARAAEQLNMTQPAITHQISSLEKELDTKLFVRTTRSVTLTGAGQTFLNDANNIIKIEYAAKSRIKKDAYTNIQLFNIGFHTELELNLFPKILKNLCREFPSIQPNLKMLPARSLRNLLETEQIDVMLSFHIDNEIKSPGIYTELCRRPLVCAMSPTNPLAQKNMLSLENLQNEHIFLYPTHKNPSIMARLQDHFVQSHPPERLTYTDNSSCALTMIRSGLGITFLPDLIPLRFPDVAYVPIENSEQISYGIYHQMTAKKPLLKKFVRELSLLFKETL